MPKHPALMAILTMTLTLLLSACASTGGPSNDETLLDCRAKADAQYKARYTPKWQAAVDQCIKQAEKP